MIKTRLTMIVALMVLTCISLSAQKPADMVGTWAGAATLEGESEPNELTLVLELKDGNLAGHMSDQYGSMSETPIDEVTLENGVFVFSVNVSGPEGQILIQFTMKVEGDSMAGKLEIPDMGMAGTWEATKQK